MNTERGERQVQAMAELVQTSRHMVVLTGAGISTPSGIPDFRSSHTGLWTKDDPMVVASLSSFQRQPEVFYNWLRPLATKMLAAQPNAAHIALAQLENAGRLKALLTQNIDDLHQRAGSGAVYELHGSMRTLTCPSCKRTYPISQYEHALVQEGGMPECSCGRVLKPDIVLFEEMLPEDTWEAAIGHCRQADLFLVIGSSLTVYPASTLPEIAMQKGSARLGVLNLDATPLDSRADVSIHADAALVLPRIVEIVLG
jgi:NAD-dependent deacetylase